jgi:hypothetical protein
VSTEPRCAAWRDLLPWHAAGTLSAGECAGVEAHLAVCAACRHELAEWRSLAGAARREIPALPPPAAARVWQGVSTRLGALPAAAEVPPAAARDDQRPIVDPVSGAPGIAEVVGTAPGRYPPAGLAVRLEAGLDLALAQVRLIGRDLWALPALGLALTALLALAPLRWSDRPGAVALASGLLPAIGMALLHDRDLDRGHELSLTAPTARRAILLLRLGLIAGYQLVINLAGALLLGALHGGVTPGWFVSYWLAPLCCLAAISLLAASAAHPLAAIALSVALWLPRAIGQVAATSLRALAAYDAFWHRGSVPWLVAALALGLAFLVVDRRERRA